MHEWSRIPLGDGHGSGAAPAVGRRTWSARHTWSAHRGGLTMRRRRWLAAASAAGAVAAGLHVMAPGSLPTAPVVVAVRDLPAGHRLTDSDLVTAQWPRGTAPDGVLSRPRGRLLTGALRRGEPVTDARVVGAGLLVGQPPGTVALAVRLTDPAGTAVITSGRRVQLLGGPVGEPAVPVGAGFGDGHDPGVDVLAPAALVLAVPGQSSKPDTEPGAGLLGGGGTGVGGSGLGSSGSSEASGSSDVSGSSDSGVLIVAVDRDEAARLAGALGARSISAVLVSS